MVVALKIASTVGYSSRMRVVFLHGWSVRNTDTYGDLPQYLKLQSAAGKIDVTVEEILLGKYVSFEDTVSIDDIARAFDAAFRSG